MTTPYFVISKEKKNLWFFISNNFFWIILLSLLYFGYHKLSFSFRKLDFYHIGSLKCIILCIFSLRIPEPLKMRCCFQLGSRPTFLTLVNQHPFALPPTTNKAVFEHFAVKLKLIQMKINSRVLVWLVTLFGNWSFTDVKMLRPTKRTRSEIPELENRVKKPSYGLWRYKTELSQIVTS